MFSADLKSSYIMPSSVGNTPSAASAQSPAPDRRVPSTAGHHYNPKTPIGLVNNGVHINPNGRNLPTIFAAETAQVLSLPSRAGVTAARQNPHGTHRHEDREISASEKLFGGHGSSSLNTDTSSHELSRMQCVTMQLQRALQNKIMQATRNASTYRASSKSWTRATAATSTCTTSSAPSAASTSSRPTSWSRSCCTRSTRTTTVYSLRSNL